MGIRLEILLALVASILVADKVYGCAFKALSSSELHSRAKRQAQEPIECDYSYPYRSYDGSCNNLYDGNLGRAGSPFIRLLPNIYDDGKDLPAKYSKTEKTPLKNGRLISREVHDTSEEHYTSLSSLMFQWGQFIAHDITYTPWESMEGCCDDIESLVVNGEPHPDIEVGGRCFPIIIDDDDYWWQTDEERCMEFSRSAHIYDEDGVRQQYSVTSSFVDGSHIYGLNEEIARSLRSFEGGKLKSMWRDNEEFLPELIGAGDSYCYKINPDDYCFAAGDDRPNMFPGLMALHTVFLRYHNKLAGRLQRIHPEYDDETLYQEARRIVIGVIQKIHFEEWVTKAVGYERGVGYAVTSSREFPFTYNASINPTMMNVFSAAALRYGHSLVPRQLTIGGVSYDTSFLFMRPHFILDPNGVANIIDAMLDSDVERPDRWYSIGMTDFLLSNPDDEKSGYDIVARNLQRGRDHGLPTFNEYNIFFGHDTFDFSDFVDRADVVYPDAYDYADDIEIYSGGLSGTDNGRSAGPLFADIIGWQHYYIKWGDRFYYENEDKDISGGAALFTRGQINEISNMTLSKILCVTVNGLETSMPNAFESNNPEYTDTNFRIPCSELAAFDINIEDNW